MKKKIEEIDFRIINILKSISEEEKSIKTRISKKVRFDREEVKQALRTIRRLISLAKEVSLPLSRISFCYTSNIASIGVKSLRGFIIINDGNFEIKYVKKRISQNKNTQKAMISLLQKERKIFKYHPFYKNGNLHLGKSLGKDE
jgi:hypothetical protein